jgi:hypothetical protein
VNQDIDCERARIRLMAALDEEPVSEADSLTDARHHLAACSACTEWLRTLESMNSRFQGVAYPRAQVDLWAAVERRISPPDTSPTRRLWIIGAAAMGWRTLQLLIDLPYPWVHPLVPLTCAIAALWLVARDPLAIETYAPELEKRGV